MEGDVANGPAAAMQVSLRKWTVAEDTYQRGYQNALLRSQATLTARAANQVSGVLVRLALIAGLGLGAIAIAAVVGIATARGLCRKPTALRQAWGMPSTAQPPATTGSVGRGAPA